MRWGGRMADWGVSPEGVSPLLATRSTPGASSATCQPAPPIRERAPLGSHLSDLNITNRVSAAPVAWAIALCSALPPKGAAQEGEWPTLTAAGLEYISPSGLLQLTLSGQLDLETLYVHDAWAGLIGREEGEEPIPDAQSGCPTCHVGMGYSGDGGDLTTHRLRVFADIFLGDHVYSLLEVRSDRGHAPTDGDVDVRVEQAFLRLVTTSGAFGVQAGRFASPFGSYAQRHLTTVDPFLRPPLAYDYRTVMSRTMVPRDASILLEWKDVAQFFRKPGAPPVWDVPYQWGAMMFGRVGPVDLRVAAMNSAPSSDPEAWGFAWDRFEDPSWVVAARTRLSASLDVGFSYNRGPWMEELTGGTIQPPPNAPPGADPPSFRDFDQEILSGDFTFARGPVMLRVEAMLDRWEVPNVDMRPTERLYNVEAQWDLAAGFYVGARAGYIDFRPLDDGLGAASTLPNGEADWDHDVYRYDGSLGYRLARNAGVVLSAYRQIQDEAVDGDTHLFGLRLWWGF